MPQADDRLRAIFGIYGGMDKAEKVLIDAGCTIKDGWISVPAMEDMSEELYDAISYLVTEWDYAVT